MASQLPQMQSTDQVFMLMQSKWRSILNPLLGNLLVNGQQLSNINLSPGNTIIPHNLGRIQQGFYITDIQGPTPFMPFRNAAFNSSSLSLASSASVTINLWVY